LRAEFCNNATFRALGPELGCGSAWRVVPGRSTARIQYASAMLRLRASLLLGFALGGCEPEPPPKAAAPGPEREVVLADPRHRVAFDRARDGIRAMKSLFGTAMTPNLATDLQFKCADLKGARATLEHEDDPLVQRVRADVDVLCGLEVPVASARLEIARIEEKKENDYAANVKRECTGLKLALGDLGPQYATNPLVVDLGAKFATLCPPD